MQFYLKDETVVTHWGTIICDTVRMSTLYELLHISLKWASRGIERGVDIRPIAGLRISLFSYVLITH